ncbi:MAG TPA: hypothetical protein VNY29_05090 [Terriglobales bacterium]|jgi:hypothetical protein|nr:hypothetical protein [Terriglobales bacterium]
MSLPLFSSRGPGAAQLADVLLSGQLPAAVPDVMIAVESDRTIVQGNSELDSVPNFCHGTARKADCPPAACDIHNSKEM